MALDWDKQVVSSIDPFSESSEGGQMGGANVAAQITNTVSSGQMGENDIVGSSLPETFAQTNRRHTPRQPQSKERSVQMGGGYASGQQMG